MAATDETEHHLARARRRTARGGGGDQQQPSRRSAVSPLIREATALRLKTVADPVRMELLELLRPGPATLTELIAMTGLPRSAVSKHLNALTRVHLLTRTQEGNFARFAITDQTTIKLLMVAYGQVIKDRRRVHELITRVPPSEASAPGQGPRNVT